MTTKIREALELGQQIWLDNLSRSMLRNGELEPWLEKGVTGITSNPSIFLDSIGDKELYPELGDYPKDKPCGQALLDAMIDDVAAAADKLRSLYDSSDGQQGYVSIELNPHFAEDVETSIKEAEHIVRRMGDRPNFMIKIASNNEGLETMKALLIKGVNVNMTLIFDPNKICEIMDKAIEAHEEREQKEPGAKFPQIVMSVFVSRMDAVIDPILKSEGIEDMMGKSALHIAQTAVFQREANLVSGGWEKVIEQGRAPKILWASTGVKNPETPDTYYVDKLIFPETIDTVPVKTLNAFLDHGTVKNNYDPQLHVQSMKFIINLKDHGANPVSLGRTLFTNGLKQFQDSYDCMFMVVRGNGENLNLAWEYEELKKFLHQ